MQIIMGGNSYDIGLYSYRYFLIPLIIAANQDISGQMCIIAMWLMGSRREQHRTNGNREVDHVTRVEEVQLMTVVEAVWQAYRTDSLKKSTL